MATKKATKKLRKATSLPRVKTLSITRKIEQ